MERIGKTTSIAISAPITALGASTARTVLGFRQEVNKVAALTGGTGAELTTLRNQAKELGRTTKFSASETAAAQAFLAQAGFKVNQIYTATPGVLALAAAGNLGVAETADIASNVLTGYGKKVGELGRVSDVMARAAASANVNIQEFGYGMTYAGSTAAAVKMPFETTAAVIGKLNDAGIKGEMAGTTLRGTLNALIKPSSEAAQTLTALGIKKAEVFDDQGGMRDFVGLMERLVEVKAKPEDVLAIFGARPGSGINALLNRMKVDGVDVLRNAEMDLFKNADGAAAQQAKIMEDGLVGSWNRVKSTFEAAKIAIGDSGFEADLVSLTNKASAGMTSIGDASPKMLRTSTWIAAVAGATGPALIGLGAMTKAVGWSAGGLVTLAKGAKVASVAIWRTGVAAATMGAKGLMGLGRGAVFAGRALIAKAVPAVTALGAALFANPIGIVIGSVAALTAAGVVLYRNWDAVAGFFGGVWDKIKSTFADGVSWITSKLGEFGLGKLLDLVGVGGDGGGQLSVDTASVSESLATGRGQDGRARVEIDINSGREQVRARATAIDDMDLQMNQGLALGGLS